MDKNGFRENASLPADKESKPYAVNGTRGENSSGVTSKTWRTTLCSDRDESSGVTDSDV